MMLRNVDRMTSEERSAISVQAKHGRKNFGIGGKVTSSDS
jgi:hypothetical protein